MATPGDGLTYSVANILMTSVVLPAERKFDGVDVDVPVGLSTPNAFGFDETSFPYLAGPARRVVLLQATDNSGAIVFQSYYYGWANGQQGQLVPGGPFTGGSNGLSTNVRSISVWPGATATATRIAICGETHEHRIPNGQAYNPIVGPVGAWHNGGSELSGFIAVFDGTGANLWSHLFFDSNTQSSASAITDVAIRVEGSGAATTDVVTYCGITSHGNIPHLLLSSLRTSNEFLPLPPKCPGDIPSDGGANFSNGQWDGLVGRIVRNQLATGAGASTTHFQCIVGGPNQDLLYGLTEIDANRFCVVGSTALGPNTLAGHFPSTTHCVSSLLTQGSGLLGTALVFDAGQTPSGRLELKGSTMLGAANQTTHVRDVLCHGNRLWLVGSTTDPALPVAAAFQTSLLGSTNSGFIAVSDDIALQPWTRTTTTPSWFTHLSYFGTNANDGLYGIAAWNEFPDHVAILGDTRPTGALLDADLVVATVFRDTPGTGALKLLRSHRIVAAGHEVPAAPSPVAANGGLQLPLHQHPGGGGIAVDQNGRVTIVGSTDASGFPVTNGNYHTNGTDAIRARFDMLPVGACVGGLDGIYAPYPSYHPPQCIDPIGFAGGTTPVCALSQFGNRIGGAAPSLMRSLIDLEGTPGPGAVTAILIDRPPATTGVIGAVLQYGLPLTTPTLHSGAEIWTDASAVAVGYLLAPGPGTSLRFPLQAWPNVGGFHFTVQCVCLTTTNLGCTGANVVASPAMFLTM